MTRVSWILVVFVGITVGLALIDTLSQSAAVGPRPLDIPGSALLAVAYAAAAWRHGA